MKIAIACDHGGLALKNAVAEWLNKSGYEVVDFGTNTFFSCDYPDFGVKAAEAVASGACAFGVVVCTTGIGISIANVLALGGGMIGVNLGLEIVKTFLETPFSEEAKHIRRIEKIAEIENKYMK